MGSTTNHSMFEALFDRRLKPDGSFAEELKTAGYDAARAEPTYPTELWVRCLEIARRHRFAELSDQEAYRRIGREFSEGFLETLVGRIVGVALPFMSPRTFVRRLANYLRLGRSDTDLIFDLKRDEPGAIDAVVHNPSAVPGDFVAAIIDAAFARLEVKNGTVVVRQDGPYDYHLEIRWS
ncbi:MAG: DUF2378 family protein [Myxococcota bacterium]